MAEQIFQTLQNALSTLHTREDSFDDWALYFTDSTDSTMNLARELARDRAPTHGVRMWDAARSEPARNFVVLARAQTAGRGRNDRAWVSAANSGIYATYAFFPDKASTGLQAFSLAIGLAVERAVRALGGAAALKWPNDVIVWADDGPKKLSGVLVDAQSSTAGAEAVFVGIGLNLYRQEFPAEVPGIALEEILREPPDYALTFARLSAEVQRVANEYFAGGFQPLCAEWNQRSGMFGCKAAVSSGGFESRGTVREVLADGALVFLPEGASEAKQLYSAEITLLKSHD